jgi:putative tryptophan/tyrosine transport system substrate-binding protein
VLFLRTATVITCWLVLGWLVWLIHQPIPAVAAAPKLVIILSQDSPPYADMVKGFRSALASAGVQPEIEVHSLKGNSANASNILRQFEEVPPVAFLTVGSLATQAVLAEHDEVPVITSLTARPEKYRTKGNVTGVGLEFSLESQLDAMRRILPDLAKIGVLYSPKENQDTIDAALQLAKKLGVKLVPKSVETPRDIPDALESLANNVDILWGIMDQVVLSPQTAEPILLFSFRNKIPFAGLSGPWVKAGALYALERDYGDIGNQCGEIAIKVLNKVNPRTIQIAPPKKVLFSVNLKTARSLKIELPQQILDGASQVFQ